MVEEPSNKAELIGVIAARRSELEKLVTGFPEALRETPASSGWSLKDHLAHVSAWEKSLLALLSGDDRAAAIGASQEEYARHDTDSMNDAIFRVHHEEPFADVIADFYATHRRVLEGLNGMDDDALQLPYSHYQPNDAPKNSDPVVNWIHGNTWDHYAEHIEWLTALRAELER